MRRPALPLPRLGLWLLALWLAWAAPLAAQEPYFTQEGLNEGLDPVAESLDRDTPLATVEAFQALTRLGRYAEAAHLLNLAGLPPERQAEEGARRAELLAIVLERKVVMPWSQLTDRPDGWISGSADDNRTGRVRRSILIDTLELDRHRVPIRLNRVRPGEETSPVWLFSQQTVGNIPLLYELYGPTEIEQALPDWAKQRSHFGMYVWELLFIPLLLVLVGCVAPLVYWAFRWLARRERPDWLVVVARGFKWPATILTAALLVNFATSNVLVVTGMIDAVLSPLVLVAYVFAATMALVLVTDQLLDRISNNNPNELADPENAHLRSMATTIAAARKTIIVIAVLAAAGLVLTSIDTMHTFGFSLLASAGAVTIVLGFAAREVLGNILASVQIALNRSARIGDQLWFEGHFCTVERIHFTYVQLMIWNSNRLIVPVSYFVKDAFQNWSLEEHQQVRPIRMTLAPSARVDRMRERFAELLSREDPDQVGPMARAKVHVVGQDAFGVEVRFEVPTTNPATFWEIECRLREGLHAAARDLQEEEGRAYLPSPPADRPEG